VCNNAYQGCPLPEWLRRSLQSDSDDILDSDKVQASGMDAMLDALRAVSLTCDADYQIASGDAMEADDVESAPFRNEL
jgi:hypothetical protein